VPLPGEAVRAPRRCSRQFGSPAITGCPWLPLTVVSSRRSAPSQVSSAIPSDPVVQHLAADQPTGRRLPRIPMPWWRSITGARDHCVSADIQGQSLPPSRIAARRQGEGRARAVVHAHVRTFPAYARSRPGDGGRAGRRPDGEPYQSPGAGFARSEVNVSLVRDAIRRVRPRHDEPPASPSATLGPEAHRGAIGDPRVTPDGHGHPTAHHVVARAQTSVRREQARVPGPRTRRRPPVAVLIEPLWRALAVRVDAHSPRPGARWRRRRRSPRASRPRRPSCRRFATVAVGTRPDNT